MRIISKVAFCGLLVSLSSIGVCDEVPPVQLLKQYCFECHGEGASEGNLALDQLLDHSPTQESRAKWWKVLANLRAGTMPPPSAETKLSKAELQTLSNWLKFEAMASTKPILIQVELHSGG